MDKRIKNILILIFGIIFLIAGPLIIIYSQGYRFDFEAKKIVKTGGLYFKTQPTNCEIYLDGKINKKTDFLFGTAFIKDLLPKKYDIKIQKAGFFPWEKNLEVKEELVTEARYIILFPQNPNFSVFLSGIEDYFFSLDEKKIILKKFDSKGWNLEVFNLEKNNSEFLVSENNLSKKEVNLLDINWSFDSTKILLKTEIQKEIKYFIVDISKKNGENLYPLDYLGNIEEVSFNPQGSNEIFFFKNSGKSPGLFKSNYQSKEINKPILQNLLTYKISNENIFWLGKDGFLHKSDFSGKELEVSNSELFKIEENSKYEIKILPNQMVLLKENNILHYLNPSSKVFEKILEPVNSLNLSPDWKKIYFANDYEIWFWPPKDLLDQSQIKKEQISFLTRFSKKIENIFWLNSDYLIFNTGNKIKIAETDNRDNINIVELKELENPKIFWGQTFKKLYILSNKNLYIAENLLP